MMFCAKCGKENPEGAKFCNSCGASLDADVQQPVVVPAQRFYQKKWFTWLSLFFCWPLGIVLLWTNKLYSKVARVIITLLFLFMGLSWSGLVFNSLGNNTQPDKAAGSKSVAAKVVDEVKVPMEYRNALAKAQMYSDKMYMSKAGLYEQLTSQYGEQFTAEAADYALANVKADYRRNALEKGKFYQRTMHMSKSSVYEQLTSSAGEKFTPEEAQYAVDNLPN